MEKLIPFTSREVSVSNSSVNPSALGLGEPSEPRTVGDADPAGDFRDAIGQVPWLGDLPVLGALFRSANYQREQSELVIIVSARRPAGRPYPGTSVTSETVAP